MKPPAPVTTTRFPRQSPSGFRGTGTSRDCIEVANPPSCLGGLLISTHQAQRDRSRTSKREAVTVDEWIVALVTIRSVTQPSSVSLGDVSVKSATF